MQHDIEIRTEVGCTRHAHQDGSQERDPIHGRNRRGEIRGVQGVPRVPEMEEPEGSSEVRSNIHNELPGQWRELGEKNYKAMEASLRNAESYLTELMGLLSADEPICAIAKDLERIKSSSKVHRHYAKMVKGTPKTVAELFNPKRFAPYCKRSGLIAAAAFDLKLGDQLLDPGERDGVKRFFREQRPGLTIISPPCTLFSIMQNMNVDQENFQQRLREARVLLHFACEIVEIIEDYSGIYLLEQPMTSRAWMERALQKVIQKENCILAKCDQCQFGLHDRAGGIMKKPTGWITNSPRIAEQLNRQCQGEHQHTPVLGSCMGSSRATQAQEYPPALIKAILQGYCQEIKEHHKIKSDEMEWLGLEDYQKLERRVQQKTNLWLWFMNATRAEPREPRHHEVHPLQDEPEQEEAEEQKGKAYLPRERPFSTEQLVRRAHEGLGHPGNARLARILKGANASKKAIEYAKNLVCSTCQQRQLVRPPRAAAPPKELPPNHTIGIDTVWLPTPGKKRRMALNIVCWSTRFQMVIPLRSHTATDARRAYLEWIRFMGVPQRLYTDLGKEFCSAFQDGAELDETLVEPSALEMPTQRSITERAGKTFKEILVKAMDNYAVQSDLEWRDLVDIVNMTVNRLANKSGFSPCQRLLGYTPKMPGGLQFLTEEEKDARSWARRGDLQIQRAQTMRLAAARAFHEVECQQALTNSLHAGRREVTDFEVGQTVFFWRKAPGDHASKESPSYWRGPAKVILTSPPGAIWISFRRHIVKAAPEQLRLASAEEHQSLSSWMEGLSNLRHILEEEPKSGYIDLTKESPREELDQELDQDGGLNLDQEPKRPKYKIEGKTSSQEVEMKPEEDEWLWHETHKTLTRFHRQWRQTTFKPNDVADCPIDYNRLKAQRRTTMYFEDGTTQEIVDEWQGEPLLQDHRWKGRTEFQMDDDPLPWEKTEAEKTHQEKIYEDSSMREEKEEHGTKRTMEDDEEEATGFEKKARREEEEEQTKESRGMSRALEEAEESDPPGPAKRQRIDWIEVMMTTLTPEIKKQKGQKEIKLKELLQEARTKFWKATKKEVDNNIQTGAYEILSPEESEKIRREGHHILQSRYVLVEKRIEPDEVPKIKDDGLLLHEDEHGGFKAKARHVMKGFSEPDSEWLEAATPQVAPETVLLVLQTLGSKKWIPGYLDFTQAFHSGDEISRLLFAELPAEGLPGVQDRQLLRLKKHCYGLLDGPYQWYSHLQRILKSLGYEQSQADPCLFFLFDKPEHVERPEMEERQIEGIIGVATDDLLHGGGQRHWEKMQWIKDNYKLGKFSHGDGRFVGKEIQCLKDGRIRVHQQMYVKEKIKTIPISKERRMEKYNLCSETEISTLRALLGALAWLAKESRPDLIGRVRILQQCMPKPYIRDLLEANALAKEATAEIDTGITIMPIEFQKVRIGSASDASWGNSPCPELEEQSKDFWEERGDLWIRHHVQPRHLLFHPGAATGGPQLHELEGARATWIDGELFEDTWNRREDVRKHGESIWKGHTVFMKKKSKTRLEIHEKFLQVGRTHSHGGHIVFAYHQDLEVDQAPQPISILGWKSYKLKRCTVNTLAAEAQAMIYGIGASYWIRFMWSEIKGLRMNLSNWQQQIGRTPFIAVTDSRSLFDNLSKSTNIASHVDDKRTAIDLTILKNDLQQTRGQLRWVAGGEIMISDALTKKGPASFLRGIMKLAYWTLFEVGAKELKQRFSQCKVGAM